jgi:hypothetical protein
MAYLLAEKKVNDFLVAMAEAIRNINHYRPMGAEVGDYCTCPYHTAVKAFQEFKKEIPKT